MVVKTHMGPGLMELSFLGKTGTKQIITNCGVYTEGKEQGAVRD